MQTGVACKQPKPYMAEKSEIISRRSKWLPLKGGLHNALQQVRVLEQTHACKCVFVCLCLRKIMSENKVGTKRVTLMYWKNYAYKCGRQLFSLPHPCGSQFSCLLQQSRLQLHVFALGCSNVNKLAYIWLCVCIYEFGSSDQLTVWQLAGRPQRTPAVNDSVHRPLSLQQHM